MPPTWVCGQSFDAFVDFAPSRRRGSCHRLLCLIAGVLLVACEAARPPTMSVEEAKRVTVQLSGQSFVPPPRTINDVLHLLEGGSPQAGRHQSLADAVEPANASATELASFYLRRGNAAEVLGRAKQEYEDLTRAAAYARRTALSESTHKQITRDLAWAELDHGNYRRAIELMQANTVARDGWAFAAYGALARMHAWAGDLDAARRAMRSATALTQAGLGGPWGGVDPVMNEAAVLEASGRWAEAETATRKAIDAFRRAGLETDWPIWILQRRMKLVVYLVNQGRLVEAEIEAREALQSSIAKTGKYSKHTAGLVARLGVVLDAQGRHAEAEQLKRIVIDILEGVGAREGSLLWAGARSGLAATLVSQGRWAEATEEFARLRAEASGNEFMYERFFAGGIDHTLALVMSGAATEALPLARQTVERWAARFGEEHLRTGAARGIFAMALAATGEKEAALAEFRKAVPVLLSWLLPTEEGGAGVPARNRRIVAILEAYLALLDEIRNSPLEQRSGIDVTAEMFRIADAARDRSVQQVLRESAARVAVRDPSLAELVRREQDAALQTTAMYGSLARLLSAPPEQQDGRLVEKLRAQVDQLSQARRALADEIGKQFPRYAELVGLRPGTVEDARAALRPGEALLALYVGARRTFVWAVPRNGPVQFASVAWSRERVGERVQALRQALDATPRTLGEVPPFDVETAHELYAALLRPLEPAWRDANSLLVVPDGPLAQVPFSLLVTEPAKAGPETAPLFANYRALPWLVRRVAVTQLPSVAALRALRALPAGDRTRRTFAGFGDPWFSTAQAAEAAKESKGSGAVVALRAEAVETRSAPLQLRQAPRLEGVDSAELARLPRLPETADEVQEIAQALGANLAQDVFLGIRANEQVVKTLSLKDRRVLAFATHGLRAGDLNGLLQPALALSAPQVAGVEGDGLLTMEEVLRLQLDADWVVLSACNTAAGQGAGAEAVSGLGRAFFYAGTRALLVTHWPVETTSARALVTEVFRRQAAQAELSRAEALREAMLALMDGPGFVHPESKRPVFSYAHPLFWAPFALVGDGG